MARRVRLAAAALWCGAAVSCIAIGSGDAFAQAAITFRIAPQPLNAALRDFGLQSGMTIVAHEDLTRGKTSGGYTGTADPANALRGLLQGTGLTAQNRGKVFMIRAIAAGQAQVPAADQSSSGADIVVTAQKRSERIQDVPIAITALSTRALDQAKIEGGSELLRAVPNVTFSKNNFSGFNFSIRGIGTKAVSITTDPAVAISYNNVPLIRNRLFEQEYFDVDRVEVLRGPQGTLYGRNATGGVVNMITNKPNTAAQTAEIRAEVGNYATRRLRGYLNVPLTDNLAVRVAGAATIRQGFDYNTITEQRINGRELWQTRFSAKWRPDDATNIDFVWEHFQEDDDRSRTGKQLCDRDPGRYVVNGVVIDDDNVASQLSQGCRATSLFRDSAYGTPNGLSLPIVQAGQQLVLVGYQPPGAPNAFAEVGLLTSGVDPYGGMMQSRNLREIASIYNPKFRAKNDVFEINIDRDIADGLTAYSQTSWTTDSYYSTQDYNRFNTVPVFNDSTGLLGFDFQPVVNGGLTPNGFYNDPQLGPSDRLIGVDLDDSKSSQFYQEFRLQSNWQRPFNFSLGANYLRYKTVEDYFVLLNVASALNQVLFGSVPGVDNGGAPYIDPNPIATFNRDGHNYFRSRNPYILNSGAAYGEAYYELRPDLKVTGGLRFTVDRKSAIPVPSQLLLGDSSGEVQIGNGVFGGFVGRGYPEGPAVKQTYHALTGRVVVDWKPELSFTDKTLVYGSFSRGYKGGGVNPPGIGANPVYLQYVPQPTTFRPEYVNALEIGMKNTALNGDLTLNLTAFGYAYKGYQISKIIDRTAINENIDSKIWGAELESIFEPVRNLSINLNLGYLGTRIDRGRSIDVMDRTQGVPGWLQVKPSFQLSSNCVAPADLVARVVGVPEFLPDGGSNPAYRLRAIGLEVLCGASYLGDYLPDSPNSFSGLYGFTYNPATDSPNGGQGFFADLKGKQLPNSPHFTGSVGATYTIPIGEWGVVLHGDYYRQSRSYARMYNTEVDRLQGWSNVNLLFSVGRQDQSLVLQFYIKNLLNDAPITDAFINSDDSGLTTNVFTLDPRILGFNVTKRF